MAASKRTSTGRRRSRGVAVATAAAAVLSVAGLSAAPAASAPSTDCPDAFPVGDLVADQPVTGLTVSSGTTPEGFTGEVLGVLENGLMPGLDLVMVRLSSPEIDRVGIWHGMSGSPVYAQDGRLIGAVSMGFSGGSAVAGVTPAADMLEMLTGSGTTTSAGVAKEVTVPARMADRIVSSGDATAATVESGMTQLRLPFGVAGLSQRRFDSVARRLDIDGVRLMRAGVAAADTPAAPMVPGGNLAATFAAGDITAGGIGTVTAVCGTEVLGFGHPMDWTGPTSLAMHGAEAVYVQEDIFGGFKMANIGAPVGTVNQDRMPGIVGELGPVPQASLVTSTVASGTRERTGRTDVYRPEFAPSLAFSHVLANMDRVFDGIGKGTGQLSWTVQGTREDGTAFLLDRADVYASPFDITFESAWDLLMALEQLEYNGIEEITIDAVDADATLSRGYDHYALGRVELRRSGEWLPVRPDRTLRLEAGTVRRFRVHLTSPVSGTRRVVLEVPVPRRALGMFGSLDVFGGNGGVLQDEEEYYEEGPVPVDGEQEQPTFDEIVAELDSSPLNDQVVARLAFHDEMGSVLMKRERRTSTGLVVDGAIAVGVRIIRG